MYLILCGSSMSFMESPGLGQRKPSCMQNSAIQDHAAGLQGNSGVPPNLSEEDNALIYGIQAAFRIISTNWMFGTA